MSEAKAHINKRTYTVANGKGDRDRTDDHNSYSSGYSGIDWSKGPKFDTPTKPQFKIK